MNEDQNFWKNARIAIVGCGAVGTYYGAMLARAGADVHFLLRSDYAHVKEHGLQIFSHDGDLICRKCKPILARKILALAIW